MANRNFDYEERERDGNAHQKSLDVLFANENFIIDAAGPSLTGQDPPQNQVTDTGRSPHGRRKSLQSHSRGHAASVRHIR